MVKVTSYPEKLEKEFYEHLYDTYENKFYTGTYQPTGSTQTSAEVQSNYLHYKGDINAYLVETLKITDASKIEETIMKEVHAEIEPLIKIFVVAQALNEYQFKYDGKTMDAAKLLETFTAEDIKAGIYDSEYEYDENLSEKENKKAEKQFKKEMEKSLKNVEKDSAFFLVDNKALRNYKKSVGNKQYRQIIKAYGETNIRAILQTNKLFGLLTAAERVVVDKEDHDHTHTEFVYTERDGVKYIDYKIIRYTTTDK